MGSEIKFFCDFCMQEINSEATKDGNYGVYLTNRDGRKWSIHLNNSLKGPHICGKCIESIVEEFS